MVVLNVGLEVGRGTALTRNAGRAPNKKLIMNHEFNYVYVLKLISPRHNFRSLSGSLTT